MKRIAAIVVGALVAVSGCKKEAKENTGSGAQGSAGAAGTTGAPSTGQAAAGQPEKKNPEGCNSDLSQDIQADYTLTEKCSPYTLSRDLSIEVTLTIEPGVELRAKDNSALSIGYGARAKLVARGTAEKPIRFVAEHKEPGSWVGVRVFSQASGSTLENVVIEHAGTPDLPALMIEGPEATLKNVKLVAVKHQALKVSAETTKEISGLDLKEAGGDADALVETTLQSASAFGAGNVYPENAVISLRGTADRDVKLTAQGAPWRIFGDIAMNAPEGKTATLTIEAGNTIQATESAAISIGYNSTGSLKVLGTAERPVAITRFGPDAKTTPWVGIGFYANAQAPQLEYLRLENTGADHPAIRFEGARGLGKLSHVTVANCASGGLRVDSARDRFSEFDGNAFNDITGGAAIRLPLDLANTLGSANTFGPKMYVELFDGTTRDTMLTALSAPYRLTGDVAVNGKDGTPAALTIQPGVTVQLADDASLSIGYTAAAKLTAKGTADKKIAFVNVQGATRGIRAFNTSSLEIENATFTSLSPDEPMIAADALVTGFVKNSTFKGGKAGLKKCDAKIEVAGLKGEGGAKAEVKCD